LTTVKGITIAQGETNNPKGAYSVKERGGLDCSRLADEVRFENNAVHGATTSALVAAESSLSQNNITDKDDLVVDDFMVTDAARMNVAQTGQGEADICLFTFTKSDIC
jgi:hypothetical protein